MGYRSDVALKFVRTDLEDYKPGEGDASEFYERYKSEMGYRSVLLMDSTDSLVQEPEGESLPLPVGLLSVLQGEFGAEVYVDSEYVTVFIPCIKWYATYPPIKAIILLLKALEEGGLERYYGYCRFGEDMEDQDHEGWIEDRPYVSREIDLQTSKDAKIVTY